MRLVTLLFHDVYETDPSESGFAGAAADRYKLTRAAFEAQLSGLHRARSDRPVLATELPPPGAVTAPFALTADDGGVSYYTIMADRLEALGGDAGVVLERERERVLERHPLDAFVTCDRGRHLQRRARRDAALPLLDHHRP